MERRTRPETNLSGRSTPELSSGCRRSHQEAGWSRLKLSGLLRIVAALSACAAICLAVDLKPETAEAFDQYITSTQAKLQPRWSGQHFLWFDDSPEVRLSLLAGAVVAQPIEGNGVVALPGGLVQDWLGAVFVPHTTLKETLSVVQDYPQHPQIYKPDVTEVKVLSHAGNDYTVRTRVVKSKFFISDVVDIDNQIQFVPLDSKRVYSRSVSQRIVEISNEGKKNERELPVGHDRGLVWRVNGYWFFAESDGGVFITCESITLTRDIPFLLAKVLSPIVHELPAEALKTSLEQTRRAIVNQPRLTAP